MTRGLLVFLAFLGVFVAGAVTGGVLALRVQRSVVHERAAERFTQQQFKRVAEELALTPEQKQRIRPILARAGKEIQARRREMLSVLRKMEDDVRTQLTDEQRTKFDAIRAEQRERLRSLREQRLRGMEGLRARLKGQLPPGAGAESSEASPGN